jgi:Na+/melibiose symporter-like transporter
MAIVEQSTPGAQQPQILDDTAVEHRWQIGTLTYDKAGLIALFWWLLLGDFALSMRDRSIGQVVQLLLKRYHASDTLVMLLMTVLPTVIGMFLGPIVSFRSDRYRSRWGRRIPFLLIPTPVAALSMMALAACPQLGGALNQALGTRSPGLDACVLCVFTVFWTAFEISAIVALAVLGGLIADVVPHQFLGRFFGLFRAVSLGAGMIFNFWIIGTADSHAGAIFVGMSIIFGVGFTVMCLRVKEGTYPPPEDIAEDHRAGGIVNAIRVYFSECFALPYYRWFFVATMLAALVFNPFNWFSIYYTTQIGMSLKTMGRLATLSYGISLGLAYPLGSLVDRFHALRVALAALALATASQMYGAVFVHTSLTFGIALVAHTVLSGTYFTASASLGQALLPRLKFGQYSSAGGLVLSVGTIVASVLVGQMLDRSGHIYRLTFVAGSLFGIAALASMLVVYSKFMALGGPQNYLAPDVLPDARPARSPATEA